MSKSHIPGETKEQRKIRKRQEKNKTLSNTPIEKEYYPQLEINRDESVAFVLGNGTSRKPIDVKELRPYGKIYGCNGLYREFSPDHLIAVDTKMIKEISGKSYQMNHQVWTNPNRYTREVPRLNLFNPNLGWSSGPSALMLASTHVYKTIYILGFDYEGIGLRKELVNNVYAGTENYKRENERATYFGNWARQTATCIKKHNTIKYIRVVEDQNSFVPETLSGLINLTHITVDLFKKRFNLL